MTSNLFPLSQLPAWVPSAVRLYLTHTEGGQSLREIARAEGVHASTVLRQVRRFENRRDDPLVDGALGRLKHPAPEDVSVATPGPDAVEAVLDAEARRVLPLLAGPGTLLAVAPDMDRAVVLREAVAGTTRLAILDRPVAEAFALREWIVCVQTGRVLRYEITAAGRAALRGLSCDEAGALPSAARACDDEDSRRTRPITVESPVTALARRRDKDGNPFLQPDLVAAAERLREDFETAQTGPRVTQDWDRLLTGPAQGSGGGVPPVLRGAAGARARVAAALGDLGPGLADMALRCCCYMEGLETAERRLGWSARSGKIVLRIALLRLQRHYDELGEAGKMMG